MSGATLTAAIRDSGTAREIARVGRCSEATAARWRRGETMPNPVSLARLMGWSDSIRTAMLRLAGLDDLSMDIEEARLRRELAGLQAKRAGPPDVETAASPGAAAPEVVEARGRLAAAKDTMSDFALRQAERALRDAERRRR